ncbi:hypothetical protein OKW31_003884 [Paraburkholderia atlantica]
MRRPSFVIEMRIWSLNAFSTGLCSVSALSFAFNCCKRSASIGVIAGVAARGVVGSVWLFVPTPGRVSEMSRPPPCTTLGRAAAVPSLPPSRLDSGVLK